MNHPTHALTRTIPCPCARCEADRTGQPTAYELRVLRGLDVAIKVLLVAIAVGFVAVVVRAGLSGAVERLVAR